MPYAAMSDDTAIHYNDWGTGTPVVLIHGWPATSDMWEKNATYLAERGLRVITYDRRGCGKSSQPWNGYDYDTLASDLNTLMEGLDLKGATLVGFSMGGGEVVRYLSKYGSGRVTSAVLVSAVTPYLLKTDDNPDGVDASVFEDIEKEIRKDRAAFLPSFLEKFYGRSALHHTVSSEMIHTTTNICMTASLRSTLAEAHAWSSTDFRNDVKSITIPVRVIHGTGDKTVPIDASSRRTVKLLHNASLTEYDGEPHGLVATAADRFNEEILQFVGGSREPITAPLS